jgi:hypothetical protein
MEESFAAKDLLTKGKGWADRASLIFIEKRWTWGIREVGDVRTPDADEIFETILYLVYETVTGGGDNMGTGRINIKIDTDQIALSLEGK